jgi:hypothetical protein
MCWLASSARKDGFVLIASVCVAELRPQDVS